LRTCPSCGCTGRRIAGACVTRSAQTLVSVRCVLTVLRPNRGEATRSRIATFVYVCASEVTQTNKQCVVRVLGGVGVSARVVNVENSDFKGRKQLNGACLLLHRPHDLLQREQLVPCAMGEPSAAATTIVVDATRGLCRTPVCAILRLWLRRRRDGRGGTVRFLQRRQCRNDLHGDGDCPACAATQKREGRQRSARRLGLQLAG